MSKFTPEQTRSIVEDTIGYLTRKAESMATQRYKTEHLWVKIIALKRMVSLIGENSAAKIQEIQDASKAEGEAREVRWKGIEARWKEKRANYILCIREKESRIIQLYDAMNAAGVEIPSGTYRTQDIQAAIAPELVALAMLDAVLAGARKDGLVFAIGDCWIQPAADSDIWHAVNQVTGEKTSHTDGLAAIHAAMNTNATEVDPGE